MAGITTSFPFKPFLHQRTKTSPFAPSFSSFDSTLFGVRVANSIRKLPLISLSFRSSSITARYGRGSPRSDDDKFLDISSIRSDTVRLIDEQQNMVGIVPKFQAIQMADDAELDLVILSPDADPPVVRIMDYNKYKYEQQKKKKDQQKKSAASRMDLKELKMGYNIDQHDYAVRLKAARKFLNDGDKVKVIVNLKGRENEFRNMAIELIKRFQNDVGELATEESKNLRERNIFIVLVPNKAVLVKGQEPPQGRDKSPAKEVRTSVPASGV